MPAGLCACRYRSARRAGHDAGVSGRDGSTRGGHREGWLHMNDRLTSRQPSRRSTRSRLVQAFGLVAAALLIAGTAVAATPRTPAPAVSATPVRVAEPTSDPTATPAPAPTAATPEVQPFPPGAPGPMSGGHVPK